MAVIYRLKFLDLAKQLAGQVNGLIEHLPCLLVLVLSDTYIRYITSILLFRLRIDWAEPLDARVVR